MTHQSIRKVVAGTAVSAMLANVLITPVLAGATARERDEGPERSTATPIKHVIIIIGENRSFDHVFATYTPVRREEHVDNLLAKGIVNADGTPGPNYAAALQSTATDVGRYQLDPPKSPYAMLPPALTGGPAIPYVCAAVGDSGTSCADDPKAQAAAAAVENGLASDYTAYLLSGGTGQPSHVPDLRIQYDGRDASHLPPGPFQLTSATLPYDSYTASPVHRFFQMWQQLDCTAAAATWRNPSGCAADLFPWVEVTIGAGSNGKAQAPGFNDQSTGEGATSMAFYNVQQGDAPYLRYLADTYAMSDNYHQALIGGTGANHVALGTGDAVWFSDGNGNPAVPPSDPGHETTALNEIENPNPQPGTNNFYTQDGYGGGTGSPAGGSFGGGSYVDCSDPGQPGVEAVRDYLGALRRPVQPNCAPGHYYLLNNYNPGYFGDGSNAYTDTNAANYVFTIPPSSVRTIGDELAAKRISWAYYGDQFNRYLADKYQKNPQDVYCNICNWAQYSTSIMTDADARAAHLKDTTDLYAAIAAGSLPAVSYVKPSGLVDGHPASSKLDLYEGFVKKIVRSVQANPRLWAETAIFVTFDEGGGYWDSGYVQPLDFFGDGTRVPMIVVSPYTQGGHISHTYADHVSTLKFIERNWRLEPLTRRSRDNLPNPVTAGNPYLPVNSPAIGDLFDLFHFER